MKRLLVFLLTIAAAPLLGQDIDLQAPAGVNASSGTLGATTFRSTATSQTLNFLRTAGTLGTAASTVGASFQMTGAGSNAPGPGALDARLLAGHTGAGLNYGSFSGNFSAGTGNDPYGQIGSVGSYAYSSANSAGAHIGLLAFGGESGGSGGAYAGVFRADGNAGSGTSVGILSLASVGGGTRVGGYFGFNAANPTLVTGVLIADNAAVAAPIFIARDNGAALPTSGPTATAQIQDGATFQLGNEVLTTATATALNQGQVTATTHAYHVTTAMINTAIGAGTTGDVTIVTLPAKTVVRNAYLVLTEAVAGPNTMTVACGRTSATYIDYITAQDAKAAANTVYGDASAERGTNLTGWDLPSYTATTAVVCHYIGGNTTDLTTGQQTLILETTLVP